jgi:hypothetical protein
MIEALKQVLVSNIITQTWIIWSEQPTKSTDAGQQTKELKPGKERSLEEEESQRREERRVGRCKIYNFH